MKYFILLLLPVALLSCSKEKPALPGQLDSLFSAQIKPGGPGVSVLIMKGDSTIFSKSYGLADLETKEPVTDKTLFNVGSITKTFVMNSILILRDEGKLSLEDSLIKYFPEFKNKEIGRKVKIKHLLTHTSGLPDLRPVRDNQEFYLTADDAQNWAPILQADSLEFEPGSQYEYSNPAFNALALIVEKVSGQPWRTFVAERIFKPAGMPTSTITDGPHPESGVSHGYVYDESGTASESEDDALRYWSELDFGEEPTFCAAGNGGVWSSTSELWKYQKALEAAAFSNANTIAESKEIKTFPQWKSNTPPFIGWSWFIGKTDDGVKTVGHTGTQGGFYADYVTIPEKKIFYIMLANFPIDRNLLNKEVLKLLGSSAAALTDNTPK
jgi:CubicO group peptidase (beta-lactamase class C family)